MNAFSLRNRLENDQIGVLLEKKNFIQIAEGQNACNKSHEPGRSQTYNLLMCSQTIHCATGPCVLEALLTHTRQQEEKQWWQLLTAAVS